MYLTIKNKIMKQQTAVEWLMEQISYDNGYGERVNSYIETFDLSDFFKKAKDIEKQQIEEAWDDAKANNSGFGDSETYYEETYTQSSE
jgi:hypothetical protein